MKLYAIDEAIESILHSLQFDEYGALPICIQESLDNLRMEKEIKVLQIAKAIKNMQAESTAIKAEIDNLAARRKTIDKQVDYLREYLTGSIAGESYKDASTVISWRRSTAINIIDEALVPKSLCSHVPESWVPDKLQIKSSICAGHPVAGTEMIERNNLQIK